MDVIEKLANVTKSGVGGKPPVEGAVMTGANPANQVAQSPEGRRRIPLTTPKAKLAAPAIPGYVCQWFADRAGRVQAALDAGFEFVSPTEISVNNHSLAGDPLKNGTNDLGGSRVSILGGAGENGQGMNMFLMKQRREYWDEDQAEIAARNEQVASSIRGGNDLDRNPHEAEGDGRLRYVKGAPRRKTPPNLFTPRKRG